MRIALIVSAISLSGCGVLLDLDPRPDASSSSFDGGMRDASRDDGGRAKDAGPDPCLGAIDGTECPSNGQPSICLGGVCISSSCGDGVVDSQNGEECEGNSGCVACRFACHNDGECLRPLPPCVTSFSCSASTHTCEPTVSATDVVCEGGRCQGGRCIPERCGNGADDSGEDCDDGNVIPDDGCEIDCTFTCSTDADCDDGSVCTGIETCHGASNGRLCEGGKPIAISDCAYCDPMLGEVRPDSDGDGVPRRDPRFSTRCGETDCDDSDPNRFPGAIEVCDGIDNDCNGSTDEGLGETSITCAADNDSDGFPGSGPMLMMPCNCLDPTACRCPAGSVPVPVGSDGSIVRDCWDSNADVHPGQMTFFTTPYCAIGEAGCVDPFDYNCDGNEELRDARTARCQLIMGTCRQQGWSGEVPSCGVSGTIITCGTLILPILLCSESRTPAVQGCR
jgi:cysteine-rich repeat protein